MGSDLRDLIASLDPAVSAIDARDAALLVLGWAAALRRSELVGLDWHELGFGTGYVQILERGLVVTLPTSKGSQDEAVEIVIPCPDMPTACDAVRRWALLAGLKPGEPVFRWINKGGAIAPGRLNDGSVSRIVKTRLRALAIARGKSEGEARKLVAAYSSHSMRAGYATTAAEHDEPGYRIQQRMRHKSMDTTGGYIRSGQQWSKSGLKGSDGGRRPQNSTTDAIARLLEQRECQTQERIEPAVPTRSSMFPPPHFCGTFGWAHALSPAGIPGMAPMAHAFGPYYQIGAFPK